LKYILIILLFPIIAYGQGKDPSPDSKYLTQKSYWIEKVGDSIRVFIQMKGIGSPKWQREQTFKNIQWVGLGTTGDIYICTMNGVEYQFIINEKTKYFRIYNTNEKKFMYDEGH
jgi:hypothetical protein